VNTKGLVKVTSVLRRNLAHLLLSSLSEVHLEQYQLTAVRRVTLHESRRGFGLIHGIRMVEEAGEMIVFLVDLEQEDRAVDWVARQCELHVPGHGTVYSEDVELISVRDREAQAIFPSSDKGPLTKQSPLVGISCVVQRGEANSVARVALDMGSSVPCVSFGHGMGLRDRVGLLRVAIPAQKEIIQLVVSPYDAETMMRLMIRAGELDRPGKGFIYLHPIRKGLIDTKITHGPARHVASMEQIIATLDELKGDMGWRKRAHKDLVPVDPSYLLLDLADISVICNEGTGQGLMKCAMRAGAGGATISRTKCLSASGSLPKGMSSAREVCNTCVPRSRLEEVIGALEEGNVFGEEASGEILIRRAPKAYTYF
jgi:nitrogen regulatory protein PII